MNEFIFFLLKKEQNGSVRTKEGGNTIIVILVLIGIIWGVSALFGRDDSSESPSSSYSNYGYNSYYSEDYDYDDEYEMENPYYDDSGHHAGYEWAEENEVDSCDGNSYSFIEGCEEYLEQREEQEEYEYQMEEAANADDYYRYDYY